MRIGKGVGDFAGTLRRLRLHAGMSQDELAAGIADSSHISLLERGKRKPSQKLVFQLADRLGVSPEYLSSGFDSESNQSQRRDLLFAENALQNGDAAMAEELLKSLSTGPDMDNGSEFSMRVRYLNALTQMSFGRLEIAATELRQTISMAQELGFPLDAVEMTIKLCACYRESGDSYRGLELLQAAQQSFPLEMRSTETYARLLSTIIGVHYIRGDYSLAQNLTEEAMRLFDSRSTPAAQAAILWNASLVAEANSETSKALMLAQEAARLYSRSDSRRVEGQLRILISWLLTNQSPPNSSSAREELVQAETLLTDSGSAIDKARLDTELARVEWLEGNFEEALRRSSSAIARLSGSNDLLQSAHAHLQAARAHISLGNEIEAAMNRDVARDMLARMEPSRSNALAWRELGDIYLERNLQSEAIVAYQEAMRHSGIAASAAASKISNLAEIASFD